MNSASDLASVKDLISLFETPNVRIEFSGSEQAELRTNNII